MIPHRILDVAALEAAIGSFPPAAALKVIPYLDRGACDWIARSPLFFVMFADERAIAITPGASPGRGSLMITANGRELLIPLSSLDHTDHAGSGAAFASLFLLPGIGETLRVNGTVVGIQDGMLRVTVTECYGHCAKALIRSEFWLPPAPVTVPEDAAFIQAVRFIVLATANAQLNADLSPKGDPAGLMVQSDDDALLFADRPGNRRLDSFRNIVERPHVAMAFLVPGSTKIAIAEGVAAITTDPALRRRFDVSRRTPSVVVRIALAQMEVTDSPALASAHLWPVRPVSDIDPAKLFVEHVRSNRADGAAAALTRAALSVPGAADLLRRGLEKDYKENLY